MPNRNVRWNIINPRNIIFDFSELWKIPLVQPGGGGQAGMGFPCATTQSDLAVIPPREFPLHNLHTSRRALVLLPEHQRPGPLLRPGQQPRVVPLQGGVRRHQPLELRERHAGTGRSAALSTSGQGGGRNTDLGKHDTKKHE